MRGLVVLLVVAAAAGGFLLGRLTAPERGGLRGTPRAGPGEPPTRERAPEGAASAERAAPAETPREERITHDVVAPAGPVEDAGNYEDLGILEIDFTGCDGPHVVWIGHREIRGGYEELVEYLEEGAEAAMWLNLSPEVYDIWWFDASGRRLGTRAAVETGQRTYVRAADCRAAPPIPEGSGLLEITLEATWGGGLSSVVHITGRSGETSLETDEAGHGGATLAPGRYQMTIGDRREDVTIEAGKVASRRIAHANEGDLLFEVDDPRTTFGIGQAGDLIDGARWGGDVGGAYRQGFVYVAEGERVVYLLQGSLQNVGVPLGKVHVHAGRTTWFRPELPKGGANVRVRVPDAVGYSNAGIFVRRIVDGHEEERGLRLEESATREARLSVVLAPGRYSVTAYAARCEFRRAEIDVADRMVELSLDLTQAR